jgi:endoglucanase
MWDEEGNKNKDAFSLLHHAIGWAFDNDLRVIVDLHILRSHHFNTDNKRLWTDPAAQERFWEIWEELSAELIQYPVSKLAYELMNEAVSENPDNWNNLIAKGIERVRRNEPDRVIVVGSNDWQQVHTFKDLKVPAGDPNLLLSFHYYEPFFLTHHQAPWTDIQQEYTGEVHYPGYTIDTMEYTSLEGELLERIREGNGYWDAARIEADFMKAKTVASELGLPLFCGEFGCYPTTPAEVRNAYYKDMVAVFDKLDIAWTHWNYKNDFPVVHESTLEPIDAVMSALIPQGANPR